MNTYPKQVTIIEVGPRDGLQNESTVLDVTDKVNLINELSQTGLTQIECGSFVSPKWVPQMANSGEVLDAITRNSEIRYSALTPNTQGYFNSVTHNPNEVAVFTAASDAFTQKNINCSVSESLMRFEPILHHAKQTNLPVRGYVSTVVGCPYAGKIQPDAVLEVVQSLLSMGCYEVSLGDTIGVATPKDINLLLTTLLQDIPAERLAVHFHNTYGQALANVLTSLEFGISRIDTAIAGLGGCPYAHGASGNVATEDVIYMLNGLGITHGVDLNKCIQAGRSICQKLGKSPQSHVNLATKFPV